MTDRERFAAVIRGAPCGYVPRACPMSAAAGTRTTSRATSRAGIGTGAPPVRSTPASSPPNPRAASRASDGSRTVSRSSSANPRRERVSCTSAPADHRPTAAWFSGDLFYLTLNSFRGISPRMFARCRQPAPIWRRHRTAWAILSFCGRQLSDHHTGRSKSIGMNAALPSGV
jgi:hypothetical protein